MRYGKLMVCLFTALFLAVAVFFWAQEPEPKTAPPVSVTVSAQGGTQNIRCWENEDGAYFFFLPSYAELSQVQLHIQTGQTASIDGRQLTEGMSCEDFQWNTAYDLTCGAGEEQQQFPLTFVRSEHVSAMYVDVFSGSMEYIHKEKGNAESGTIRLYTAEGELDHGGALESIQCRGNVTWALCDKKSYSMKLSDGADLLGMGQAQKWILLANAFDATHLRDKTVYDFARTIGLAYSPESQWVDLYLNGEYAGLYLLSERNEVDPQRVDIGAEDSFLVSAEIESRLVSQHYPYVSTDSGIALRIHHAAVSSEALETQWQSIENAIVSEDGTDPVSGKHWTELIDLDSWAKKYLIEEIFGNLDASISQFFYYDSSLGKVYAGPVWDYDSSMAWSVPEVFFANTPHQSGNAEPFWYYHLYRKETFYDRVVTLYETLCLPALTDLLENGFAEAQAFLRQAAAMDRIRWPGPAAATETEAVRKYLEARVGFLNSLWLENVTYCTVYVDPGTEESCVSYAVLPGGSLPSLSVYEESPYFLGWYRADTDTPFDVTQPIYEDLDIYARTAESEEEQLSSIHFLFVLAIAGIGGILLLSDWHKRKRTTAGKP